MRAVRVIPISKSNNVDIRCGFGTPSFLLEWTLFLILAYILAYVAELPKEWFEGIMNGITHLAALPAIWTGSVLVPQIVASVTVSIGYHIMLAVDEGSELYNALEQFDVGMSVALIASLLFVYMDHIYNAPVTFLAVGAACFPEYNIYIAGFVILVGYPITTLISYQGSGPFNIDKWILLGLQVVSIIAYLLSDTYTEYSLHSIWHVASLLSIYYMIRIQQDINAHPMRHRVQPDPIVYRF
jgi:hypothetical protein